MSIVTFDTLKFVEKLKKAGLEEKTAIALAEAQSEVFSEALDSQLATKQDLVELKLDMIKWMVGLGFAQIALLVGILAKMH